MPIPIIAVGVTALALTALALWVFVPVILDRPIHDESAVPVRQIIANYTDTGSGDLWPQDWPHEAPEKEFTLEQARRVLQGYHRRCRVDSCPRKRAAMQAQYRAGKLQPDKRIEQWVIR